MREMAADLGLADTADAVSVRAAAGDTVTALRETQRRYASARSRIRKLEQERSAAHFMLPLTEAEYLSLFSIMVDIVAEDPIFQRCRSTASSLPTRDPRTTMAKQTRRACGVSKEAYDKLTACATFLGTSRSSILEALIANVLDGTTFEQSLDLETIPDLPRSNEPGGGICMF
jgi:hypothetical protein